MNRKRLKLLVSELQTKFIHCITLSSYTGSKNGRYDVTPKWHLCRIPQILRQVSLKTTYTLSKGLQQQEVG